MNRRRLRGLQRNVSVATILARTEAGEKLRYRLLMLVFGIYWLFTAVVEQEPRPQWLSDAVTDMLALMIRGSVVLLTVLWRFINPQVLAVLIIPFTVLAVLAFLIIFYIGSAGIRNDSRFLGRLVGFVACFAFFSIWIFLGLGQGSVPTPDWAFSLANNFVVYVVSPVAVVLSQIIWALFSLHVLKHFIFFFAGIWIALQIGSAYLADLFEMKDRSAGFPYLNAALFGSGALTSTLFGSRLPSITIANGKVSERDKDGPLFKIGGPGYVSVHLGNAALFERIDQSTEVIPRAQGAGGRSMKRHRLDGYEHLREIVDLREHQIRVPSMELTTRDGLGLVLTDIQIRYRVARHQTSSPANPYPFEDEAVRRVVYGQVIKRDFVIGPHGIMPKDDELTEDLDLGEKWGQMVAEHVKTQLSQELRKHSLDELLQPGATSKFRTKLTNLFYRKVVRDVFEKFGTQIVWVGVGMLEGADALDIDTNQIERWQNDWLQEIKSSPQLMQEQYLKSYSEEYGSLLTEVIAWFDTQDPENLDDFKLWHVLAEYADQLEALNIRLGDKAPIQALTLAANLRERVGPANIGDEPLY